MRPRRTGEALYWIKPPSGGDFRVGKRLVRSRNRGLCTRGPHSHTEPREGAPCQFACVEIPDPNCTIYALLGPIPKFTTRSELNYLTARGCQARNLSRVGIARTAKFFHENETHLKLHRNVTHSTRSRSSACYLMND